MLEYSNRETRHKFIAEKFSKYLVGSILNIGGGGRNQMLNYIQPQEYLELDNNGQPDIKVNLDEEFPLPIDSNRFDTVICTDVLEHLDEFHRVFKELIRISNNYIIISVPNALLTYRSYLMRNEYTGNSGQAGFDVGRYKKYYGLPIVKPKNRHRWFFSYTEAEEFFHKNASRIGYCIVEEYAVGRYSNSLKGKIVRILIQKVFGNEILKDWIFSTYWCVLKKEHA